MSVLIINPPGVAIVVTSEPLPMTGEVTMQLHPHRLHSSCQHSQISGAYPPAGAVALHLRLVRFTGSGNTFRQTASPFTCVPVVLSASTKPQVIQPVIPSVAVDMVDA